MYVNMDVRQFLRRCLDTLCNGYYHTDGRNDDQNVFFFQTRLKPIWLILVMPY